MKVLLLGYSGKMGTAIGEAFKGYEIIGLNSKDFDARDFNQVREIVAREKPDVLINCVAKLGMHPCEQNPMDALTINSFYPRLLAELSNEFKLAFAKPILAFAGLESKLQTDNVTSAAALTGTLYNSFFWLLLDDTEFNNPDLTGFAVSSKVSP